MSIQAGIWNFAGEPVNCEFLTRVTHVTAEYGPDGEVTSCDGALAMLYRPLHTTHESRLEHQPYRLANGKFITWDGRLDNPGELITDLRAYLRDDRTDVALVATAFDQWGTACFAKILGDWAVCIWDPDRREITLARDYLGVRQLFYYLKQREVLWCSHLAPLALCGDQFTVCDEYIAGYLAAHPDADLTPYRELRSVPPGKVVTIRNGRVALSAFWGMNSNLKTRYKTDAEYEEHFRFLFRQAVRRRLRADSPVLAELSGGWDSSSIVCMADDILTKEGAGGPRLDTFSYYDSREPNEDDFFHFTKIEAKRGRTGIHADLAGSGDSLSFDYPDFPATPGFGSRAEIKLAMSRIFERCRYRIVLSGLGGDEMNGMALDPLIQIADLLPQFQLAQAAKLITSWGLFTRRPWLHLLLGALIQLLPTSLRAYLTERGRVETWISRRFARSHRLSVRQLGAFDGPWSWRPSVKDAYQTLVSLGRQLTYAAPSLAEQRYPYLDQNLVEFLTTIPLEQLLRPGQRRFLMRRALADLLPPEILARKTKAGAARCYSVALNEHWSEVEAVCRTSVGGSLGYVDSDRLLSSLLAMRNGQVPTSFIRVLKALSLELWLRQVIARGTISLKLHDVAGIGPKGTTTEGREVRCPDNRGTRSAPDTKCDISNNFK